MTLDQFTQFFGWCSVINIGVLLVSTLAVSLLRRPVMTIHSRLMGVAESELPRLYFQYLAYYKIAVLVLNVVPYIALKAMA